MHVGPSRGAARLSMIDAVSLVALAVIVVMIVVPQARVRGLLRNEDAVIADLADIEKREDAHRAAGTTDADHDGRGEYASLAQVLGDRAANFERIEGTDVWRRHGYYFTVLLPDREKRAVAAGSPEVYADYAEVAELLVAWPAEPGRSGMRAYCRWPGGVLLQHAVDGYPYSREPPVPNAFLVANDANGPRPADRYDHDDWRPPVFATGKRAPR
jgi:hypothetical protein